MTGALALLPEVDAVIRRPGGSVLLRPAPRREPPFDDELDPGAIGPLDRPLPFDEWHRPRRALTRIPVPVRRTVPDPAAWCAHLLLGVIETAAGKRPLHQLSTLVSRSVALGLGADVDRMRLLGQPHWLGTATVRSIRASEPTPDVAELCATLEVGARVRAVALRLEVRRGRWCCVRLILG